MKEVWTTEFIDDKYSKQILKATKRFKTVSDISMECNIPISTVYRKINHLQKKGFLKVTGFITNGVRLNKYKCDIMLKYGKYNPKVKKILGIISLKPGICYNELQESSGMPNGTLSHYIAIMLKDSKIMVKRTSRRSWFFLPETKPLEMELIISLRKETSKDILSHLLIAGSSGFTEILKHTKKAPPTVSLTITHLVELGLIRRIPGARPTYELIDRDLTFETIKRIEPNTSDKLKDRFADTFSYF